MEKYCPKCRSIIKGPRTSDMFKYAKYWRDNRCYVCDTTMIIQQATQQNVFSPGSREIVPETSMKKRIKWEWIIFPIILLFLAIFFYVLFQPDLKVTVNTLKTGDSSVLWITNEENQVIELIEIELNDEYKMSNFPDSMEEDMMDTPLPGRGKKYIQPKEKVMFFTNYFYDESGKKFEANYTAFIKIRVIAEVGSSLFSSRIFVGKP